jgi:hypothetical protein
MFKQLGGSYDDLWRAIIRPPRDEYSIADLGPNSFILNSKKIIRKDIILKNEQNQSLYCSHFEVFKKIQKSNHLSSKPLQAIHHQAIYNGMNNEEERIKSPCVIYLHGNSSSRLEALNCLPVLLPLGISLFCFDFAGCGMSSGDFISLGIREKGDVKTVIEHLRKEGNTSLIGNFSLFTINKIIILNCSFIYFKAFGAAVWAQ